MSFVLSAALAVFAGCAGYELDEKICNATGGCGKVTGGGSNTPPTIPINRVYLFPTLTQTTGGFGGRPGADALCQTARNATVFPENQCANVRAFVSLTATDEIVDMAANYGMPTGLPFNSPNNTLLANNQADLLDGTISVTLATAGITLATGWYSFSSLATGSLDAANCLSGASGLAGDQGRYGQDNGTATVWMSMTQAGCDIPRHLMCVCF